MRKPGEWMAKLDDRILEFVYENGSGTPTRIASSDYIRVSKPYISRRLGELADYGLLEHIDNGVYQLTTEGRYYLAGGYDAEAGEFLHDTAPEEGIRNYDRMGTYMESLVNKLRDDQT